MGATKTHIPSGLHPAPKGLAGDTKLRPRTHRRCTTAGR
jgi:hypothetical protein